MDGVFKAKVVYFLFLFPIMNLEDKEKHGGPVLTFDLDY